MNIKRKLTSRKFWLTVASMLASIGTAISGTFSGNETMVTVGVVCTAISTAIYTVAESFVDSNNVTESEG